MCCMRLAEIQDAKITPISPSAHHRTTLSDYIVATKVCIDNRKKIVKRQYLFHMSSQYGELGRTNGCWHLLASLGHSSKFQRVSRLFFVTAPMSLNGDQPNFARCFAIPCAGALYIHFRGSYPSGILPAAKFTLRPNLTFSYIGSVIARHSSKLHGTANSPKFAAWYKESNYGTFAYGATYIRQGGHRWASAQILVCNKIPIKRPNTPQNWSIDCLVKYLVSFYRQSEKIVKQQYLLQMSP